MGETWGPKRTQSLKLAPSDPTMWYRKAINVQLFWHGTGPLRVWGQGAGNEYWGENKVSDVRWCPCSHWDIRGDHLPVTSRTWKESVWNGFWASQKEMTSIVIEQMWLLHCNWSPWHCRWPKLHGSPSFWGFFYKARGKANSRGAIGMVNTAEVW